MMYSSGNEGQSEPQNNFFKSSTSRNLINLT